MTVRYENDYLVAGRATDAVTPHFRVAEYRTPAGLYVHRELIGALQELRDAYAAPVAIGGLGPRRGAPAGARGTFAFVTSRDLVALEAAAQALRSRGLLASVVRYPRDLYIEIPDPATLAPLPAADALARAVRVTAAYETRGDPFQQVTGNFDGAGWSFGPLQVNFRSGTLPALFARFHAADAAALRQCFDDGPDWTAWQRVLAGTRAHQITWADARSVGRHRRTVAEPWRRYLQAVGRHATFRRETLRYAYDVYGRRLVVALAWLQGLWPGRIDHFACLCALYDLCVQQGTLTRAQAAIRARVQRERPDDQFRLVHIAVEERGRTAAPRWRADCISRRLGLLYRTPVRITEAGITARRDNLRVYLVRNVPVTGVDRYLT